MHDITVYIIVLTNKISITHTVAIVVRSTYTNEGGKGKKITNKRVNLMQTCLFVHCIQKPVVYHNSFKQ